MRISALLVSMVMMMTSVASAFPEEPMSVASYSFKGPSDPAEWGDAQWIWGNENPGTTDSTNRNVVQYFRRDFKLENLPEVAELQISADTKYWMYVNGKEVVWQGQLVRGPSGPSHEGNHSGNGDNSKDQTSSRNDGTYYETVDIAEYLQEGENSICILVWHWNNTSTHNNPSRYGGLLVSSQLPDADNDNNLVYTGDGQWRTRRSPAHNITDTPRSQARLNPTPNITYDARLEIDWLNPEYSTSDSNGWGNAVSYGPPGGTEDFYGWGPLYERPFGQLKDYGRKALTPVDLSEVANPQSRWRTAKAFPAADSGVRRLVTVLPYNCQLVPYIILGEGTPEGQQIVISTETFSPGNQETVFRTKAGAQTLEGLAWCNGEVLNFDIPEAITDDMIIEVGYRETGYPVSAGEHGKGDFLGYFNSVIAEDDPSISGQDGDYAIKAFNGGHTWGNEWYATEGPSAENNFYDELWTKAVRTLYVTMRDTYMDCPDRERGQYIGDAVNEFEEAYYSLGPEADLLTKKAYYEHASWQWEFSWAGNPDRTYYAMSNVRPGILNQEIYSQSLTAIYSLVDFWKFVGDEEVIQYTWPKYFNYLTNWDLSTEGDYAGNLRRFRPQGDPPGYNTLSDWCDWGNNQDKYAFYTVIYYMAMKSLYTLGNDPATGVTMTSEQRTFLETRMQSIETNFEKFWDEEERAYRSLMGGSHDGQANWSQVSNTCGTDVDDRVNALAVVAGLVPEERYQDMRDLFMGEGVHTAPHENASIYLEKYVQEALFLMGYDEDAMLRMARRHMDAVNRTDDTTLPEHWSGGTKNHGWSGGSMIAMSRRVTGVEPTSHAYETWHIVPQMGNFVSVDTRVPSAIGNIDVKIQKENGVTSMSVVSPGNSAEFWVPLAEGQCAVQTAGNAKYLGVKEAYGNSYAVFASSEAGTFAFTTADEADKEILKKVIAYAQSESVQEEFDHVIEAVQLSFTAALDNAVAVDANRDATPEEVESAWKTLLTEIHKLGFVAGDKETLKQLIEIAADYEKVLDWYTPNTVEPFTAALAAARATVADGNALQGDVEAAEAALLDAMLNLRYKADKSVLESVLAKASGIDTAAYTAESVAAFNAANDKAKAINNDANATQAEVKEAIDTLNAAIDALVEINAVPAGTSVNGDTALTTGRSNAKTGDTVPFAAAVTMLALTGFAVIISKKKK